MHLIVMPCLEHNQLRQEYEAALRFWAQHALPQTIDIPATSPQVDMLPRNEALSVRNAAATRLYLHTLHCAVCKRLRIAGERSG